MVQNIPDILGVDHKEVTILDDSNFYYLDPTHRQTTNMYFMESTMSLKENIWDIFEFTEQETQILELAQV